MSYLRKHGGLFSKPFTPLLSEAIDLFSPL
jgi:hypothetical protein